MSFEKDHKIERQLRQIAAEQEELEVKLNRIMAMDDEILSLLKSQAPALSLIFGVAVPQIE